MSGLFSRHAFPLAIGLAAPLPAMITAGMLGVPVEDHVLLKQWSADFAQMLGNFQHNPDHLKNVLGSLEDMLTYFREAVKRQRVSATRSRSMARRCWSASA